jgi:hypothetical protein
MTTVSKTDIYNDAVKELRTAADALDQAHAMLRDLGLQNWIETGKAQYRQTVGSASKIAMGLYEDLKNLKCPECDKPMTEACLDNRCPVLAEAHETWEEMMRETHA